VHERGRKKGRGASEREREEGGGRRERGEREDERGRERSTIYASNIKDRCFVSSRSGQFFAL
jgi:hypothetical protein